MRHVTATVTLALLLSGCMSPAPNDVPSASPTPSPSLGGPSIPYLVLEHCAGFVGNFNVPADLVAQHVPRAFGPSSVIPFLATMSVMAYDCPRAIYGNQTFDDVQIVWTHVYAIPRNESRRGTGLNVYTFDVMVSKAALSDALTEVGSPSSVATFSRTAAAGPLNASAETWEFRGANRWLELVFPFRDVGSTEFQSKSLFHRWFGSGPFTRVDVRQDDQWIAVTGETGGLLRMDGDLTFRDAAGSDAVPLAAFGIYRGEIQISMHREVFE